MEARGGTACPHRRPLETSGNSETSKIIVEEVEGHLIKT